MPEEKKYVVYDPDRNVYREVPESKAVEIVVNARKVEAQLVADGVTIPS